MPYSAALRVSLVALCLAAMAAIAPTRADAAPTRFDFDTYPTGDPWYSSGPSREAFVKDGILTLNGETLVQYNHLHRWMPSNDRGWYVEARLRVGVTNGGSCDSGVFIDLGDGTEQFKVAFGTGAICVETVPQVSVREFATTGRFFTYRIEVQRTQLRLFIDGTLAIEHTLATSGYAYQHQIEFGGGSSYWDYLEYDIVAPQFLGPPALIAAGEPGAWRVECDPHTGYNITFMWTPSGLGTQWLDIGTDFRWYAPGTFVSSGPLDAHAWAYRWTGLAAGPTYYVRINTLTEGGWISSSVSTVYTESCAKGAKLTNVERGCLADGRIADRIWWRPLRIGPQWVDVSTVNTFAPGTYTSSGPLGPDENMAIVPVPGAQDVRYYVRVNTLTSRGWVASETKDYAFGVMPACAP